GAKPSGVAPCRRLSSFSTELGSTSYSPPGTPNAGRSPAKAQRRQSASSSSRSCCARSRRLLRRRDVSVQPAAARRERRPPSRHLPGDLGRVLRESLRFVHGLVVLVTVTQPGEF